MKTYIIYKEVKYLAGETGKLYLTDSGNFTPDQERAKKITVKMVLELIVIIMQLILKHKQTFKYKKL